MLLKFCSGMGGKFIMSCCCSIGGGTGVAACSEIGTLLTVGVLLFAGNVSSKYFIRN